MYYLEQFGTVIAIRNIPGGIQNFDLIFGNLALSKYSRVVVRAYENGTSIPLVDRNVNPVEMYIEATTTNSDLGKSFKLSDSFKNATKNLKKFDLWVFVESVGQVIRNKEIEVKLNGDIIEDMAFSGHGCAISQASTSIMIDTLRGKTVEEAKEIIKTFIEMIKRETKSEEELQKLEDAIAFKNIANMPARVKCALLAWHTVEDILNKNESNGKGTINECH